MKQQQSVTVTNQHGNGLPWLKDRGSQKLFGWLGLIIASQVIVGYDESVTGSFQAMDHWVATMGNPSPNILGLITASVFIGGFLGALVAGFPGDRYGRRVALQIGLFLEMGGSIMQAAATNRGVFIGGRIVLGLGVAFTTTNGPNLLSELCHSRLRGKITPAFNSLWYVGSILASWLTFGTGHLNSNWSWRIPSTVQSIFPCLLIIGAFFMPESPRWLYAHHRSDEARAFIIRYHANGNPSSPLVDQEIAEIAAALGSDAENDSRVTSPFVFLKSSANRCRLFIILMVSFGVLWTGQGIITYYFTEMLDSVGITNTNAQTGINGGMAVWNLFCSLTGVFLADRIGRRPLWLTSFIGMAMINIPMTITNAVYKEHGGGVAAAYASVVFMFLFNGAFNLACNPLLYSYTPEVLPFHLRSQGLAIQAWSSQIGLLVNQYVNPIAMAAIGFWYYVFYLGMIIFFTVVIYLTFPETKGYPLEELAALFEDGKGFSWRGPPRVPPLVVSDGVYVFEKQSEGHCVEEKDVSGLKFSEGSV